MGGVSLSLGIGVSTFTEGIDHVKTLQAVVVTSSKVAKAVSSFWSIGNVLTTVVNFVPTVGSVMDIVEGVVNGYGKLAALGVAVLVLDAVTLGGASFVKGGIKAGVKSLIRTGTVKTATAKTAVKQVVKEIPEILFDGLTKA